MEPYSYKKKRREFEKTPIFDDSELKPLGGYLSDHNLMKYYIKKNPSYITVDNIPTLSSHEVNTERLVTQNKAMKHQEGGWPKEVDYTEEHDTVK